MTNDRPDLYTSRTSSVESNEARPSRLGVMHTEEELSALYRAFHETSLVLSATERTGGAEPISDDDVLDILSGE